MGWQVALTEQAEIEGASLVEILRVWDNRQDPNRLSAS